MVFELKNEDFKFPTVQVVIFSQEDIITASDNNLLPPNFN